jgi:hypothetical protein
MHSDCPELTATSDGGVDESALSLLLCEGMAPLDLPAPCHAGLRSRLLLRVGESVRRHAGLITIRPDDGPWCAVKAGIRAKILRQGPRGASALIEFAPAATLPVHRHHHLEEGIVLRGGLQLGGLDLLPGDYHVSPPGSRHGQDFLTRRWLGLPARDFSGEHHRHPGRSARWPAARRWTSDAYRLRPRRPLGARCRRYRAENSLARRRRDFAPCSAWRPGAACRRTPTAARRSASC